MSSKFKGIWVPRHLFFLSISLAIVLLITSEVAARDLAETEDTLNKNRYSGADHGGNGSGYGGNHGGGGNGGDHAVEARDDCPCARCCLYAGEAMGTKSVAKPHN